MDLSAEDTRAVVLRLKRAHGHLASVIRMLEDGADCQSALTQLSAVNKALSRSGYALFATGLQKCLTSEDEADQVDPKTLEKLFLSLA